MASLNRATLIGRLGQDPEARYTARGKTVVSFPLVTSERRKNGNGDYEVTTEWHNIVVWDKLAEIAEKHLSKGKTVYLEGRLQTRKWQDKGRNDRYTTEIVCEKIQMLGGTETAHGKEV